MKDNDLFTLLRTIIAAGLQRIGGYDNWQIARSFQPEQEGRNDAPTVYLHKLPDHRYGAPRVSNAWDEDAQVQTQTTSQLMETTVQVSISMDETTDPAALTPSDVANDVCGIMQSDTALEQLRAEGVGILRVLDVRNPYFVNDRNRFQADAGFDMILTHRREVQTPTEIVQQVDYRIHRV
jgi:hypothetical protein